MLNHIPFNIWDDYYNDGYVPLGKIQETYGYIEEYDVLDNKAKSEIVQIVLSYLRTLDLNGVEIIDNKIEIEFKYLTHKRLDKLIDELKNSNLTYKGIES